MKLMQGPNITYVDQEGNRGITCMALIETSHIVLHIWDEQSPGLFQLDVYSCQSFDINIVLACLKESFKISKIQYKFLDRKSDLIMIDEK
jgi:S-adenosylmethionine/arginine decarboxylase-like enzyme